MRKWLRSTPLPKLFGYLFTGVSVVIGTEQGIHNPKELLEAISVVHILIVLIKEVPEFIVGVWFAPSLLIIGVVLIFWGRRLPDPSKRRPPTTEDRIEVLESALGKNLDSRFADAHKAVTALYDASETTFQNRLNQQKDSARIVEKTLNSALDELPFFGVFLSEITRLISGADLLLSYLHQIDEYLPGSEAAKAPFSQPWLRLDKRVRQDPLVIRWALSVERHVGLCSEIAETYGVLQSTVLGGDLQLYANTWDQSLSMMECKTVLYNQRARVTRLRDGYAHKLSERVMARAKAY